MIITKKKFPCRRCRKLRPTSEVTGTHAVYGYWTHHQCLKCKTRTVKDRNEFNTKTKKAVLLKKLIEVQGSVCLVCKHDWAGITIDHIVPLAKGGKNVFENMQLLCHSCNSIKHDKIIDYRPRAKEA